MLASEPRSIPTLKAHSCKKRVLNVTSQGTSEKACGIIGAPHNSSVFFHILEEVEAVCTVGTHKELAFTVLNWDPSCLKLWQKGNTETL
jgi:hypothetical protein